jgi:hypothetical protein
MAHSVLSSISLHYEPIWGAQRNIIGIRLHLEPLPGQRTNALNIFETLETLWHDHAPTLLLSTDSRVLLQDMLDHADQHSPWIEISEDSTFDDTLHSAIHQAAARGARLIWRSTFRSAPTVALRDCFMKTVRTLSAHEALLAVKVARQGHHANPSSPIAAQQLYEGLGNETLVQHALDQQSALGVIGWPVDEILFQHRLEQSQPSHALTTRVIAAIEQDDSLERIEHLLGEDPVLSYRFLRYVNSAAIGAKSPIGWLRHGIMQLGLSKLQQWLLQQLEQAHHHSNLEPVRLILVLRASMMEHIADAGIEDDLRRELFLCGMLSQLDWFIGEPTGRALHRLPLPGRITSAIVAKSGPYTPYLEIATALESHSHALIRHIAQAHQLAIESINRAMLRTLVHSHTLHA